MFIVEYRTNGSFGIVYPTEFFNIGSHKAQSAEQAAAYALAKLGNVEIVSVTLEYHN